MFNNTAAKDIPIQNSSASSSSVSAGALVTNLRRSNSDVDKKTLEGFGITNKEMQKTFLSLRIATRKVGIGISCVEIIDKDALQNKCNDIINAVTAMRPDRNSLELEVLLPVQLMIRHGWAHIDKSQHIQHINAHLNGWATVLGLSQNMLYPLFHGEEVIARRGNVTLRFKPWTGAYLPKTLEDRIDTLVKDVTSLFQKQFQSADATLDINQPTTPAPFLTRDDKELKGLLKNVLIESLTEANVKNPPNQETLDNIFNGIVFHTLLVIAHHHPELATYIELLSPNYKDKEANKTINVADLGTAMFHELCKNMRISAVAKEFAHGVAQLMEEISSPEILKQLESAEDVLIYISVKEKIRRTNPFRVMAAALKPSASAANLEPCNSYESQEQRRAQKEEEQVNQQVAKQAGKSSSLTDEEKQRLLDLLGKTIGSAANQGLLGTNDEHINAGLVSTLMSSVTSTYCTSSASYRRGSAHSTASNHTDTSSNNTSRGSSPGTNSNNGDEEAKKSSSSQVLKDAKKSGNRSNGR
ncbi:MAG: hypothetical protein ACHQAX_08950 [Gammaproteobacteria bacterium]